MNNDLRGFKRVWIFYIIMRKVILFDYDGTIIDSTDAVRKAFNLIAEKYGMKKAKNKEDFGKLYDKNLYIGLMKKGLEADRAKDFVLEWRKPLFNSYNKIKIFNGIKNVIEKLSKNNEIYVITSNVSDIIEDSIKNLGIKGIKEVLGGDKEKSKTIKIENIKKKYPGLEVYYIGDTKGDVLEAKEANVNSIAVSWGLHSRNKLEKAKPDFIVDRPEELLKIIG